MFYKFLNSSKTTQKTEALNAQLKSKKPQSLGIKAYLFSTLVCLIFIVSVTYGATVINVPGDQPTIQAGIDAASNGDTVSVAAGVYNEVLIWQSKAIALVGAGAEVTIVDASGIDDRCMTMIDVPETAMVEGFTFTGGTRIEGGGLYLQNSFLTLIDNIITGNSAGDYEYSKGGGLYLQDSSPTLTNNTIVDNYARFTGGGLHLQNSSPTLINNAIRHNTATGFKGRGGGGGIFLEHSSPILRDNIIEENIVNGRYNGGGGFYLEYSDPILDNNTIRNNTCTDRGSGAGMYLYYSNPTLENNTVTGNYAYKGGGGGLYLNHSSPMIKNNTITSNVGSHSGGWGGGLYLYYSDPTLMGNTISNNSTGFYGGGLWLKHSNAIMINNIIAGNASRWGGGGIGMEFSSPIVTNNTITYNYLIIGQGAGIYSIGNSTPIITNCILVWNRGAADLTGASATYSNIGAGEVAGKGNISVDPMFVDFDNGDYHLQEGSPCIDAGTNSAPNLPETDKDGNPRILGTSVDMGAYEGGGAINKSPVANAGGVYEDNEGSPIIFDASASSDPDGDALQYRWDFYNDGSWDTEWSSSPTASYTWNDDYSGDIKLEVSDGEVTDIDTASVTVNNVAPSVSIDSVDQPNPHFILPNHELTFTGSFTDPGWLDTHTDIWDFGDDTTVPGILTEENEPPDATGTSIVKHAYSEPGTYIVTLTITDDDNDPGTSESWSITVSSAEQATEGLDDYIQSLPDSAFDKNAEQRQNALHEKLIENNEGDAVAQLIAAEEYQEAIDKLQHDIRAKADGSVDGNPKNDWITDSAAQQEICAMIDDIIAYLQTLSAPALAPVLAEVEGIHGQATKTTLNLSPPYSFAVPSPYPQPCNPEVWIPYTIGRGVEVTIGIYSAKGQLVRILDIGYQKAGVYISRDRAAHWDGRNEYGEKVSSGVYFYTLKAGDKIATKKLLVLR